MADVATGFLQALSAFGSTRLGRASETTFKDAKSLVTSLGDGIPDNTTPAWEQLKTDIENVTDEVKPLIKAIEDQTKVISKMASASVADAQFEPFTKEAAARIAVRIGTALMAIDEAVTIVAKKLATSPGGTVDEAKREQLMGIWQPWAQPFKDLTDGAGKVVDSLGEQVLGIGSTTKELGKVVSWHGAEDFKLAAELRSTDERDFGVAKLTENTLEVFVAFKRTEFVNPTEADKAELVLKDDKWWRADEASFGLRLFTTITPGLQNDPLLKNVMPGAKDPKTIKPTAITLDSRDGLYLGDGRSAANEKAVLPIEFDFPAVELREFAIGIRRNPAREVTGLELTTVIAAKLGDVVGMQIGGAGVIVALDGEPSQQAMFPLVLAPRWPDAIGLRINAGPIKGGGYIERKERSYGTPPDVVKVVEFGGVIQVEILKAGVFAIVILAPDPFSLVLVMGVRFPVAIELSFGFTFNGVGGILAIDRTVDSAQLREGMRTHILDRMLFPDDPVAEAPKLLDQVAHVFPPAKGGFVVGPIVELGWGSQAKIVEAKLGVVLSLPDPKIIILGGLRVRAPSKVTPLTDFRCEVYAEINADKLILVATLRDSKIAGIGVSGDLGLLIQWGGGGDFCLSVGGFNPRYTDIPGELAKLERLTIDLSPPAIVKIIVKAYLAVTAGAVMAGVRGDFVADVGVAKAHAWVQLDMIFFWVPRFGFAIDLQIGIEIEVFGFSFASIGFTGVLAGTTPWKVEGKAKVDVWFLPTFNLDLGPFEWGEPPAPVEAAQSPLSVVTQALNESTAWKAVMPANADLLGTLAKVEVDGLVAHPLAALEVAQSRVPLETHIERIGSAKTTAHRVHLGLPTTTAGDVGAVSTVTAPFAPGQFLALEGEALLARGGFEDLASGCRIAAATAPSHGTAATGEVRWRTYFRDDGIEPMVTAVDLTKYAAAVVDHSLVARAQATAGNPYLTRAEQAKDPGDEVIRLLPDGAATLRHADDGSAVLTDLGVLSATEAERIVSLVNASGLADLTAVSRGAV